MQTAIALSHPETFTFGQTLLVSGTRSGTQTPTVRINIARCGPLWTWAISIYTRSGGFGYTITPASAAQNTAPSRQSALNAACAEVAAQLDTFKLPAGIQDWLEQLGGDTHKQIPLFCLIPEQATLPF